eukprot:TRINITY_DN8847_c0_g1_i2.p1 TRINITY_DN8847_c0_g1~~TRINITY_DN8847_c0_g1_i2.p1  ORF type:complete len:1543 (-),score=376.63 TRINITY_DN8847_c0_g1_i2:61-4689(-)
MPLASAARSKACAGSTPKSASNAASTPTAATPCGSPCSSPATNACGSSNSKRGSALGAELQKLSQLCAEHALAPSGRLILRTPPSGAGKTGGSEDAAESPEAPPQVPQEAEDPSKPARLPAQTITPLGGGTAGRARQRSTSQRLSQRRGPQAKSATAPANAADAPAVVTDASGGGSEAAQMRAEEAAAAAADEESVQSPRRPLEKELEEAVQQEEARADATAAAGSISPRITPLMEAGVAEAVERSGDVTPPMSPAASASPLSQARAEPAVPVPAIPSLPASPAAKLTRVLAVGEDPSKAVVTAAVRTALEANGAVAAAAAGQLDKENESRFRPPPSLLRQPSFSAAGTHKKAPGPVGNAAKAVSRMPSEPSAKPAAASFTAVQPQPSRHAPTPGQPAVIVVSAAGAREHEDVETFSASRGEPSPRDRKASNGIKDSSEQKIPSGRSTPRTGSPSKRQSPGGADVAAKRVEQRSRRSSPAARVKSSSCSGTAAPADSFAKSPRAASQAAVAEGPAADVDAPQQQQGQQGLSPRRSFGKTSSQGADELPVRGSLFATPGEQKVCGLAVVGAHVAAAFDGNQCQPPEDQQKQAGVPTIADGSRPARPLVQRRSSSDDGAEAARRLQLWLSSSRCASSSSSSSSRRQPDRHNSNGETQAGAIQQQAEGGASLDAASLVVFGVHKEVVAGFSTACSVPELGHESAAAGGAARPAADQNDSTCWLVSCSADRAVVWQLDDLWRRHGRSSSGNALKCDKAWDGNGGDGRQRPLDGLAVVSPDGQGFGSPMPFREGAGAATVFAGRERGRQLVASTITCSSMSAAGLEQQRGLLAVVVAATSQGPRLVLAHVRRDLEVMPLAELAIGGGVSPPPLERLLLCTGAAAGSLPGHDRGSASTPRTAGKQLWIAGSCAASASGAAKLLVWSYCSETAHSQANRVGSTWRCSSLALPAGQSVRCLAASAVVPSRCYAGGSKAQVQFFDLRRGATSEALVGKATFAGEDAPVCGLHSASLRSNAEALLVLLADGGIFLQELVSVAGDLIHSDTSRALRLNVPGSFGMLSAVAVGRGTMASAEAAGLPPAEEEHVLLAWLDGASSIAEASGRRGCCVRWTAAPLGSDEALAAAACTGGATDAQRKQQAQSRISSKAYQQAQQASAEISPRSVASTAASSAAAAWGGNKVAGSASAVQLRVRGSVHAAGRAGSRSVASFAEAGMRPSMRNSASRKTSMSRQPSGRASLSGDSQVASDALLSARSGYLDDEGLANGSFQDNGERSQLSSTGERSQLSSTPRGGGMVTPPVRLEGVVVHPGPRQIWSGTVTPTMPRPPPSFVRAAAVPHHPTAGTTTHAGHAVAAVAAAGMTSSTPMAACPGIVLGAAAPGAASSVGPSKQHMVVVVPQNHCHALPSHPAGAARNRATGSPPPPATGPSKAASGLETLSASGSWRPPLTVSASHTPGVRQYAGTASPMMAAPPKAGQQPFGMPVAYSSATQATLVGPSRLPPSEFAQVQAVVKQPQQLSMGAPVTATILAGSAVGIKVAARPSTAAASA